MSRIRLDTVLTRTDAGAVVAAVAELGAKRQLSGRGVSQSREGIRKFQFATDELIGWWFIAFDNGQRHEYRDGIYSYRGNRTEESRAAEFFAPMPQAL